MGAELNKALAAFQAEIPTVPKATKADLGTYGYDYATLEDITAKVMPVLGKHGLAYTCRPLPDDQGRLILDYALIHESGEEKTGQFPLWLVLPGQFKAQTVGGLITYFRRYCLLAVTGVAPGGDDNDAADITADAPDQQTAPRQRGRPGAEREDGRVHDGSRYSPWDVPVATAAGAIETHFKRLGVEDTGVRNGYIATLTGHAVTKTSELTEAERHRLLNDLAKCRNRQALDKLRGERAGQEVIA